ncbi:hypothetical protein CSKR_112385, partial [Clonorchis sinensis]
VNWDITYLLNRRYEIARADEDFPIVIQPPADGTLYHVPAMRLFPDAQLPNDTFFIHMLFKPQKELLERGVYLFSIRDPDNTLRLSLQVVHRSAYQVVLTYNPVESVEGEKSVDFSVPWTDAYWHLGIHFEQNQTKFYTSCSDTETVPYHTVPTTGILGTRLFRDGATFFALNSGLQGSPEYYVGMLKSFNFASTTDAVKQMCTKSEVPEGSGEGSLTIDFDPTFGNILVTDPSPEETVVNDTMPPQEGRSSSILIISTELPAPAEPKKYKFRYRIIQDKQTSQAAVYDNRNDKLLTEVELQENGLVRLPGGKLIAPGEDHEERYHIVTSPEDEYNISVYDRVSGEQVMSVESDSQGVIYLPDGDLRIKPSETLDRYVSVTDPRTGQPTVLDRRTGNKIIDAVVRPDGLIYLPDDQIVAPGSTTGQLYVVVPDPENTGHMAVYSASSGQRIPGARVSDHGLITFDDGSLGISPSSDGARYETASDPMSGELVILDRRTGGAIMGAVLEDSGLIRFENGTLAAPSITPPKPYLVAFDPTTSEHHVYDRMTGRRIENVKLEENGILKLPNGHIISLPKQDGWRYILYTDADENTTWILDTRTGEPINGAIIMENGLIQLPDGRLVAPGSDSAGRYMIVEPDTLSQHPRVFDRITGDQLTDIVVDANGIIFLPDGDMIISPSDTADRYLIVTDPKTGHQAILDRRIGSKIEGARVGSDGLILLPSGDLVAPKSETGQLYIVVPDDENDGVLAVYNTSSGEKIIGASVNSLGIITFSDGTFGIQPSMEGERYNIVNDPETGDLIVLDRRTGGAIHGAVLEDNGLIRFENGTLAAPRAPHPASPYMVVTDHTTSELHVYDRLSGRRIEEATVDSQGVITLSDGRILFAPRQEGSRYIIHTKPDENTTWILDTRTGEPINGAIIMENGLIQLPDGRLVAPGSDSAGRYMIVEPDTLSQHPRVFDRITGDQLTDIVVDANGIIFLPDGDMIISPSDTADRYLIVTDPKTGHQAILDRRIGSKIEGARVGSDGLILLPSGDLVAPKSETGQLYIVVPDDENDGVLAVYNTSSGEKIIGASVNSLGIITFSDGTFGIQPSMEGERYNIVNDPETGDLIVLDRRTGGAIHGAVLEDNGLIRFENGTLAAPRAPHPASPYMVVTDHTTSELHVYDRLSGRRIEEATVDSQGVITLSDGRILFAPRQEGSRYIIHTKPDENTTWILDTRTGEPINGAIIMENGLIQLPDGRLVAPGSDSAGRYMIVEPDTLSQHPRVFDRITGDQLTDIVVDANGIIFLPDGDMIISPSDTADRYLIVTDPKTGHQAILDRRIGSKIEGARVGSDGLILLPSGDLVAPKSETGQLYIVVPDDENDGVLAVYNTSSGEKIIGASVNSLGIITFSDGTFGIQPSMEGERYNIVNDPETGDLIVLDRRTGGAIHGAVLEDNGLIRFENGTLAAPRAPHPASPYMVVTDHTTSELHVYDRLSGRRIEEATVDSQGVITLSDGRILFAPRQEGSRYIIHTKPDENTTWILDTRTGEPINGAIIMENGLIQLPDGRLVAPGSDSAGRYMIVEPDTLSQHPRVFDRITGDQLTDIEPIIEGVYRLPTGDYAVESSSNVDRYHLISDSHTGRNFIVDRRQGVVISEGTLLPSGLIVLQSGEIIAPSSPDGSKLLVIHDSSGSVMDVFDRFTGDQLRNFRIHANGIIQLENGTFAISPTAVGDRFVVIPLPDNGNLGVFDRRSGSQVPGEILGTSGFFRLPDRGLLALSNSSVGRFLLLNVSDLDTAVVFDRTTGFPLPGVEVLDNEVIKMPNGSLFIVQSTSKPRFFVLRNVTGDQVFDRRTGELLPDARVLPSGLIQLVSGQLYATSHPGKFRYLVATLPDGSLASFDTHTGERMHDAVVLEDGFILKKDGQIVAPGRVDGPRFVVRADPAGGHLTVFDSVSSLHVPDATVRSDGLIQFNNGVLFPTVHNTVGQGRYFVSRNSTTQTATVYDLVTGSQVPGVRVTEDGHYELRDGTRIKLVIEERKPEPIRPKPLEPDLVISDREKIKEYDDGTTHTDPIKPGETHMVSSRRLPPCCLRLRLYAKRHAHSLQLLVCWVHACFPGPMKPSVLV